MGVFPHRRIALAVMPVRSGRHPSMSSPIAVYLPHTAERVRLLICSKADNSRCRDGGLLFCRHQATHRFAASGQCQFNSPPWYSNATTRAGGQFAQTMSLPHCRKPGSDRLPESRKA